MRRNLKEIYSLHFATKHEWISHLFFQYLVCLVMKMFRIPHFFLISAVSWFTTPYQREPQYKFNAGVSLRYQYYFLVPAFIWNSLHSPVFSVFCTKGRWQRPLCGRTHRSSSYKIRNNTKIPPRMKCPAILYFRTKYRKDIAAAVECLKLAEISGNVVGISARNTNEC